MGGEEATLWEEKNARPADLVLGRHSFATWAIESGVQLSHLATIMGTSVRELEDTYFRWLRRTDDALRAAFDAYDAAATG